MTWLMEILKICLEEQLPIKYQSDKAFNTAKNSKYNEYQKGLASMIYKLYNKKLRVVLLKRKSCKVPQQSKFHKGFQFLLAFI